MKKSIKLLLAAMVVCMMVLPLLALEPNPITEFEYNFNADNETLYISAYKGNSPTVVFPAEIEGFPVTKIKQNGSYGNSFFKNYVETVIIPEGITEISQAAFYGANMGTVKLPNTLEVICDSAFTRSKLKSIELPKGLKSIERIAFSDSNLEKIVIPESVEIIGERAFESCNLKSIELSNGLKKIGDKAFAYSNLEKIVIPESVQMLGASCFYKCEQLESVVLPETLKIIPEKCFSECRSLTDIALPAGIIEIKSSAFEYCPLTSITIPDSVKSIKFGYSCFYGSKLSLVLRKKLLDRGYRSDQF